MDLYIMQLMIISVRSVVFQQRYQSKAIMFGLFEFQYINVRSSKFWQYREYLFEVHAWTYLRAT